MINARAPVDSCLNVSAPMVSCGTIGERSASRPTSLTDGSRRTNAFVLKGKTSCADAMARRTETAATPLRRECSRTTPDVASGAAHDGCDPAKLWLGRAIPMLSRGATDCRSDSRRGKRFCVSPRLHA